MRPFLSLTIAAFLAGVTVTESQAQTNSYLGSQWINIGQPNVRVEIKKNSIKRKGNTVTSEFAYFFNDPERKKQYLAVRGQRIDSCRPGNFTYDRVKVIQAKAFNTYYEGKLVNELNIPPEQFEYYVENPYHNVLLHRYLWNNLNPNYLKAGMTLSRAKKLLSANGFRIVKQEETVSSESNREICGNNAPCFTCGNGWSGCYVDFWNPKTQVRLTIRVDYGHQVIIDTEL